MTDKPLFNAEVLDDNGFPNYLSKIDFKTTSTKHSLQLKLLN